VFLKYSNTIIFMKMKSLFILYDFFLNVLIHVHRHPGLVALRTPLPTTPTTPVNTLRIKKRLTRFKDAIKYFLGLCRAKIGRERYPDPSFESNIVTTGGSGFGLMSIIVGVERLFLPRAEAVSRLSVALTFGNADRFHGAWPHWINVNDGKIIPFGTKDNGGWSRNLIPLPGIADRQGISKRNYHRAGNLQQPKQMPFGKAWNGIGTHQMLYTGIGHLPWLGNEF
jgi:hypothetical protein